MTDCQDINNNSITLPDIKDVFYTLFKNEHTIKFNKHVFEKDYSKLSKECESFKNKTDNLNNIKLKKWIKIKIGDYFEIVKGYTGYKKSANPGIYPLVTRSAFNNGVSMYIDNYSLDGDYLTIAPSGSSGATFHQKGKFAVDKQIKVLQLKKDKELDLDLFAVCCSYFLTQKYSYTNGLTEDKMLNEVIHYPIIEFVE